MLAFSSCQNVDVTLDVAREVLKDIVTDRPSLSVDIIITCVAAHFGLSEEAIKGRRRLASVALPRQVAMYLARKSTPSSLKEIGSKFGKDHSTVIHACNKVETLITENLEFRQTVDKISREMCE
jgi:chromosomal replication initiator protein